MSLRRILLFFTLLAVIPCIFAQFQFDGVFIITLEERQNSSHPFYYMTTSLYPGSSEQETRKFWINGEEQPELWLERGKTYMFRYNSTNATSNPFALFNNSPSGGLGCFSCGQPYDTLWTAGFFPRSYQLVTNGQIIYFAVPEDAPDLLWYGSTTHGYLGYRVYVNGTGTPNPLFVHRERTYVVHDVPKIAHPWMSPVDKMLSTQGKNESYVDVGFAINGFEGQTLVLEYNQNYTFLLFNSKDNPFVLQTFSSYGGNESDNGLNATIVSDLHPMDWYSNDTSSSNITVVELNATKHGSDYGYYQSWTTMRMGGHVQYFDNKSIDYRFWIAPKSYYHPYFGMGYPLGYVVNGVEGGNITLVRGRKYIFFAEQDLDPLVISLEPKGATFFDEYYTNTTANITSTWNITILGWNDVAGRHLEYITMFNQSATAQNYMLMSWYVTDEIPDTLYYGSGLYEWMGGIINVVNDTCVSNCTYTDVADDGERSHSDNGCQCLPAGWTLTETSENGCTKYSLEIEEGAT